ncbi:hypothetical protein ACFX13_039976 [Malus domestica]
MTRWGRLLMKLTLLLLGMPEENPKMGIRLSLPRRNAELRWNTEKLFLSSNLRLRSTLKALFFFCYSKCTENMISLRLRI